ncbi:alpha/beta fold hydrolase [Sneathiella chinensis]|uniref:Alpha/beta hydrolase n=1 Tax=Sneathiella chinensis TaxID=349750 RepID=A0ABQ5TYH8_9PROT|nr:alpha/beta hydrolase [Sneathiella chinensis]GLQ04864.1 alpha/beta hydrolase [Sneathiella chinensis]
MKIQAGNVSLEVDLRGNPSDPAVVLIAGLGFQLIDWPDSFADRLAAAGYYVIRFDNRDIGLSEKLEGLAVPVLETLMEDRASGLAPEVPYGLEDMAGDVVALLDALSIEKAHMVGMSMGGMIAQITAALAGHRVSSLTSIMSSTSEAGLPGPKPEVMGILASAPTTDDEDEIVAFGLTVNDAIGSPGFRWDRAALEDHIRACVRRSYCPTGYMRQYGAVLAAPGRRALLSKIAVPGLVIHGADDPLVPSDCGRDTADHIPGARFELVPGMGHDLSPVLCDRLADLILPHLKG